MYMAILLLIVLVLVLYFAYWKNPKMADREPFKTIKGRISLSKKVRKITSLIYQKYKI